MNHIYQYFRKSSLIYLADYSGLLASCLCFIHCWLLPLVLILLPGLIQYNGWIHPFLCSIALLSTLPMLLKKTFSRQSTFVQSAVVFGNIIMLIIIFKRNQLSVTVEVLLNTIGGLCLVYAHYSNLKKKKAIK